ncbi:PREDICTED: endoglucanase 25-like isoform X1 [Erythranthe guttata]|uniref:endoglucanase 25-like isoform X1 n=1 Tax=Erythranthe guttata TaxID=4155 RepID=UPI00064DBB13|nr:PREDICTED: endoglucanase 25-like isoform X1 [Erythranthe guttata]|eukprot:XP_012829638.1 PREDICTED: endoglucanase 25-like isoform X1 [Erythranthe guttata]
MSDTSESEFLSSTSTRFVHSVAGSGRILPSSSTRNWNSIDLDFNLLPQLTDRFHSLPSKFSKSVDFNLTISDKTHFKRCVSISIFLLLLLIPLSILLPHSLTHSKHTPDHPPPKNLTLALNQALLFFDAQKCTYVIPGSLPENSTMKFRGNSGLDDGREGGGINADLVGGFYDSGNNIKFSFSTAYTVTLLSWTVIEYQQKYADIGELDHIKDIIKWGSDYLLKLFIPPNSDNSALLLISQVGGSGENQENDVSCWQKPEDMNYTRPVSVCDDTAADLAGEIVAGLSAASLIFSDEEDYCHKLVESAEKLFDLATRRDPSRKLRTYTEKDDDCGNRAREFYNSSSYMDELVWGATWLFFATGEVSYLKYATDNFDAAEEEELSSEKGVFYWNNKLTANAILLTRIRYFMDLGYPYEDALSTNRTDLLMCSYLSSYDHKLSVTNGGLVLLKPDAGAPLQYAATASFLSKLYSDYLHLLGRTLGSCTTAVFSADELQNFAISQVNYILGDNPMKMSYMVGYGERYPNHVHHRGASIPLDGKKHSCSEGNKYLYSKKENPNNLVGAMVVGPDEDDLFLDDRDKPWFTEASISSNAGLVAALIAVHNPTVKSFDFSNGIDKIGIFRNVRL